MGDSLLKVVQKSERVWHLGEDTHPDPLASSAGLTLLQTVPPGTQDSVSQLPAQISSRNSHLSDVTAPQLHNISKGQPKRWEKVIFIIESKPQFRGELAVLNATAVGTA